MRAPAGISMPCEYAPSGAEIEEGFSFFSMASKAPRVWRDDTINRINEEDDDENASCDVCRRIGGRFDVFRNCSGADDGDPPEPRDAGDAGIGPACVGAGVQGGGGDW